MRIEFICPKCKKSYFATELLWGKQIRCTKCSTLVNVPQADMDTVNKIFTTSKYVVFERKKLINILEELKALRAELGITEPSTDFTEFVKEDDEPKEELPEAPPAPPPPPTTREKLLNLLKSKTFWMFILWITAANIVLLAIYFKFLR